MGRHLRTLGPGMSTDIDPVRRRRREFARWTRLANRAGYLLLALAILLFIVAFVTGFSSTMATLVVICLVASFILLAPSIVLGYAVKAAERDDVERGL
jgi:hypothetical protein